MAAAGPVVDARNRRHRPAGDLSLPVTDRNRPAADLSRNLAAAMTPGLSHALSRDRITGTALPAAARPKETNGKIRCNPRGIALAVPFLTESGGGDIVFSYGRKLLC